MLTRKTLLLCLLLQLLLLPSFAQLQVIERTLTDLHVTSNALTSMVRQPDGKIVVLGGFRQGEDYKTALVRFDSTGALDKTFGKDGLDTFISISHFPGYSYAFFASITMQDDKFIIAGGTGFFNLGGVSQGNLTMMRFTSTGKCDSSFGNNGVVITNTISHSGISIDEARSVTLDKQGRILVAGKTYDYTKYRFLVARYKANGVPDASFNGIGVKVMDIGTEDDEAIDIAPFSNRRIIVMGKTYVSNKNYEVSLAALQENGDIDQSFGKKGIILTNISPGADIANKLVILPGSKILCAGNSGINLLALKYKSNGRPDSSFGINGMVITPIASSITVNTAAMQSSENIVMGGYAVKDSIEQFFATRLLPDGSVDKTFGKKGYFYNSAFKSNDAQYAMAVLPGGEILQAGRISQNASTLMGVLKLSAGGILDRSFGKGGVKTLGIGTSRDMAFKMIKLPWDNSFLLGGIANGFWSMVKYQPNKSLRVDRTFGVNGVVALPFANESDELAEPNIAVDSTDKKIYMCGLLGSQLCIFKFNADGTPDEAFGSNGIVKYDGVYMYRGGLLVTPGHKLLFAATRLIESRIYGFVAMLNSNGTPDITFGKAGNGEVQKLKIGVESMVLSNYGKTIRLGGTASINEFKGGYGVASLKMNGEYDSSYGKNGVAQMPLPGNSTEPYFKYSLTQDGAGRMVLSGSVMSYNQGGYWFCVGRFTKNGLPDTTFGENGFASLYPAAGEQSNPGNEGVSSGCVDGKNCFIATAGFEMDDYFKTAKSIVAVYTTHGSLDSSGAQGYWIKPLFGGAYEAAYDVLMDDVTPNGYTLYVAGTGGKDGDLDFGLAKLVKQTQRPAHQSLSFDGKAVGANGIYPNPARSNVTLNYSGLSKGPVQVILLDVNGRQVQQYRFTNNKGQQFTQTIQLPSIMANGIYFVKITSGKTVIVEKLLKQ